jgi:heme/copper-type cytochrome/quinol oxidase subunit 3
VHRSEQRPTLDVSKLPEVVFGHKNVTWLGNVFYMTIEGAMFALVIASYFYLRTRSIEWPPGNYSPPYLWFGVVNSIVLVLSLIPARWIQKQAPSGDRAKIRLGLLILALFAIAAIVLRWFEFASLNCRWSDNAYASAIWVLLGMHTGHLITEWLETLTIFGVSLTDKMEGTRLVDAAINSDYWYFVVATALITNFVIYGSTRLL